MTAFCFGSVANGATADETVKYMKLVHTEVLIELFFVEWCSYCIRALTLYLFTGFIKEKMPLKMGSS